MSRNRCSLLVAALAALACLAAADAFTARRERVAQMSPEEKQLLLENQQRLEKLDPEQQRRLRAFAAALEQDPQADRLREVLLRYDAWAERLPLDKRAELLQLDDDARLARVKQLMSEGPRFAGQRLSDSDAKLVAAWIERRALDNMAAEQRERFEQLPAAERHRMIARMIWQRGQQGGPGAGLPLRPQDFQTLGERLSPTARRQLAQALNEHHAMQLVGEWVRQSLGVNNLMGRGGGPNWGGGDFRRHPRRDPFAPGDSPREQREPGDERGRGPRKSPSPPPKSPPKSPA